MKSGFPITVFEKDDLIVRVEPLACGDCSYIGEPLTFVCVENGCIYLRNAKKVLTTLPLVRWAHGWDQFIIPEGLTLKEIEEIIL